MKNGSSRIVKILVPVLIVAVIVALYVIKNPKTSSDTSADRDSTTISEDVSSDQNSGTVYPLKISSVDLEAIKGYGMPTVIDFGSDSCVPCKQMAPVLETLNEEFKGRAAVQFMDVWQYSDGIDDFPIQVIPTQVFFTADGKPFVPSEELAAKIPFDMYSTRDTGEHVFTVHQGGITEEQMRMIFSEMGIE